MTHHYFDARGGYFGDSIQSQAVDKQNLDVLAPFFYTSVFPGVTLCQPCVNAYHKSTAVILKFTQANYFWQQA